MIIIIFVLVGRPAVRNDDTVVSSLSPLLSFYLYSPCVDSIEKWYFDLSIYIEG